MTTVFCRTLMFSWFRIKALHVKTNVVMLTSFSAWPLWGKLMGSKRSIVSANYVCELHTFLCLNIVWSQTTSNKKALVHDVTTLCHHLEAQHSVGTHITSYLAFLYVLGQILQLGQRQQLQVKIARRCQKAQRGPRKSHLDTWLQPCGEVTCSELFLTLTSFFIKPLLSG